MRSQSSYLVVMMCMMGCFAVVQMNPFGMLLYPSNLLVAAALLIGAALIASRKPFAYVIGMGAAAVTALMGMLGAAGVRGIRLPGNPIIWVVIGLYIAFRLTLIQQSERRQEQARAPRRRASGVEHPQPPPAAAPPASAAGPESGERPAEPPTEQAGDRS